MRDFKEHPEFVESKNIKQKKFIECLNMVEIFNEQIPYIEFRKNGIQSIELYLSLKDSDILNYRDENKEENVYDYILDKLNKIPNFNFTQPYKQDMKEVIQIIDKTSSEHYKRIGIRLNIWFANDKNTTSNICHLSIDTSSALTCLYLEIGAETIDKDIKLGELIKADKPKLSNDKKTEQRERKTHYKEWIEEIANSSDEDIANLLNYITNIKYNLGDKIYITNGPFYGITGILKIIDNETLTVELNLFDKPVIVEVNISDLIPRHIHFLRECNNQQNRDKELYGKSKSSEKRNSTDWLREETIKKLKNESYDG